MDAFVRDQMALAIREAWATTDPAIKAKQRALTGSDEVPDVDELIQLLAIKVRETLASH